MRSFLSLFIVVAAIAVTGCEKETSTIVGSGDEDKVAEYNRMVQESYKGYEQAEEDMKKGGADK